MNSHVLTQQRLILWCPYVHWYIGKSVASALMGQMGSSKYQWIQKIIRAHRGNIAVYCDGLHTSMVHYRGDVLKSLPTIAERKAAAVVEAKKWSEINALELSDNQFLSDPTEIRTGDILFLFSSFFLDRPIAPSGPFSDLHGILSRRDIFKISHLTHYIFGITHLARNLDLYKFDMLCYENNLARYPFFRRYLPFVREVTLIPFAVQKRFEPKTPWALRDNRCVVTGGVSKLKVRPDVMEFLMEYSVDNFYPLRVILGENAQELRELFQIKVGQYAQSMSEALSGSESEESWHYTLSRTATSILSIGEAKKISYYSEDIVELYNGYKFSLVTHEIQHAPALGFFEAMACGTVPIGIDDPMYRDLGMKPDQNFLKFDGQLGGLLELVTRIRNDPNRYQAIPEANKAVVGRLTEESIAELFLQKLTAKWVGWASKLKSSQSGLR